MEKHELAEQLRARQRDFGLLSDAQIDAATDDEMIHSYITC